MSSQRQAPSFASHAATYAIGTIAQRLVGFLMLPIYTRYLTPGDYGAVGLLTVSLALLEPFFGARLARAIPAFYFDVPDEHSRRAVVWSALTLTGAASAVTAVVIVLLRYPASQILFGSHQYALATGLFAVNMLSQPIEYTGLMYIRILERSRLFLGISMAKMLLQIVLNLLLVVHWKLAVVGVVLSGIISSLAVGVGLTIYIAVHLRPAFDRQTTVKMLQFCWPVWFAGLAGLYIGSSGALYLRLFDSLGDVGLLELGLKFATAVSLLVWAPFFQHWEPVSYRYHKEPEGREKFQVAFVTVSALMFTVGLGVSIFSEPAIKFMAAPAFYAAADSVPILTLGTILSSLVSFFAFGFFATRRTRFWGLSQYVAALLMTVAYLVLIPKFGLEGAVAGQCLTFAIQFTCVYFWSKRYHDPGFDIVSMCVLGLIAVAAYACSNVILRIHILGVDLMAKSLIFLLATALMAFVVVRSIRSASPSTYDSVRLALRRFWRIELAR